MKIPGVNPVLRTVLACVSLLAPRVGAASCDADVAPLPALTNGETLVFQVDDVRIIGIPGLVRPAGTLTMTATPSGGTTLTSLEGSASARAPLIKPYDIWLRLVSKVDPVAVHSLGFEHHQKTSNGGIEDFDHVYGFDLAAGKWQRDEEIRKLPARPQDILSSVYLARAMRWSDTPCVADIYFDRRQNPVTVSSKPNKPMQHRGVDVPVRAVRWDIGNAAGSIKGGTVYVTEDAARTPLRLELHFSFATIGMSLVE
jgi:hypothetical protein